jgi:NADPH2:quinone reductase
MASPMPKEAHAVHIKAYGPPSALVYATVPLEPLAPHAARIRTLFAAINHTDLEIRAGHWPIRNPNPFPYVPGVEVIGSIAEVGTAVRDWQPGQIVITMMQGLGGVRAERPGAYAEFVTVDAGALAAVPADIDPAGMAALGLGGVTAFEGLRKIGQLRGKRVLVTGAAGGVGSAAVSIARVQGATVVGLVTKPEQAAYVRGLGADEVIVSPKGKAASLEPDRFDGVLDVVGGELFGPCVAALRSDGVLSLVGAVAGGQAAFDAWQLIRPVTLTGYSTESLDGRTLQAAVTALCGWLETGAIRPPAHQILALSEAARAHDLLEQRSVTGRILLAPTP